MPTAAAEVSFDIVGLGLKLGGISGRGGMADAGFDWDNRSEGGGGGGGGRGVFSISRGIMSNSDSVQV